MVLDDDRLAEDVLEFVAQQSCVNIELSARRIGHDHADRPFRVGLGRDALPAQRGARQRQQQARD